MRNIPSIDGFRAVSVMLVISQHLSTKNQIYAYLYDLNWGALALPLKLIRDGQLGVNVFFIISGFLITHLLVKEEQKHGKISIKSFYIRRSLRIFPAFYSLLFVYFLFQQFGVITVNKVAWLSSLTYTKYLFLSGDWFTAHFWSLSIEEHFYLLWPFVFVYAKGQRKTVACLFILIPIFSRFLVLKNTSPTVFHELSIFNRMDSLGIGCLLALNYEYSMAFVEKHKKWLIAVAIFMILCMEYLSINTYNGLFGKALNLTGVNLGPMASIPIGVLLLYYSRPRIGWCYKFLNTKPLVWIGTISYSLYLWQQFFISGEANWYNNFPANFFLTFAAATLSYHLIEKPSIRLKHKFSKS